MKHLTPLWTLIENTWKSYKLHFKKLWPLFLLGSIGDLLTRFNFTSRTSPTGNYLAALNHIPMFVIGIAVVAIISILFFLIISKLALFKSITDIHNGKPATVKSAYKKGLNLFWPYVLLSVLIYFTLGGSFVLLVVPFIAFYIYLIFAEAQKLCLGRIGVRLHESRVLHGDSGFASRKANRASQRTGDCFDALGCFALSAILGQDHVDRGDHEQCEDGAHNHSSHQNDADAVARARPGAAGEDQREMAGNGGHGGHQDGAQAGAGGLDDGLELVHAGFLELVGELHNKNAVL